MDQARFSTDSFHNIPEAYTQIREVEATHITQLDPFQVGPQPLTRIELWRIGTEPLQMEEPCRSAEKPGPCDCGGWGTIPHDDDATGHLNFSNLCGGP